MKPRRHIGWLLCLVALVIAATPAAATEWQQVVGQPEVVFGVENTARVPLLVVRAHTEAGENTDFFIALPATVAAEVSRYIVGRTFSEAMVEQAQLRAAVEVAALSTGEITTMSDPFVRHGARQSYLRNLKFGLARLVREAAKPSGKSVVFFFQSSTSGLQMLTGLQVGNHRFDFGPRPDTETPRRRHVDGSRTHGLLSWAMGQG